MYSDHLKRLERAIDLAYEMESSHPSMTRLLSRYLETSSKVSNLLAWTTEEGIVIRKLQSKIAAIPIPKTTKSIRICAPTKFRATALLDKEGCTLENLNIVGKGGFKSRERSVSASAAEPR